MDCCHKSDFGGAGVYFREVDFDTLVIAFSFACEVVAGMFNSAIRRFQVVVEHEILVFQNFAIFTEDKCRCDEDFSVETAVEFGRLYKRNGQWKFEAIGTGQKAGLGEIP